MTVFGCFFLVVVWVDLDVVAFIFSVLLLLCQLILDQLAYFKEYRVDVDIVLGTGFYEFYTVFFRQFLSLLKSNLSIFVTAVALVTHNDFTDALRLGVTNFLEPVLNVLKGFSVSNRVHKCNTGSTFIISLSNGLEPFLPGSVPDLHLNLNIIDINSLDLKIDSNGRDVGDFILLVDIP